MVDRQDKHKTFQDFYLSEELLQALTEIGYTHPTPVQASSIPLTMAGIDLIVQSQTGTGKTAAFGIPVVDMLEPDPGTIEVLVLAPTRELAKQVSDEFTRLTQYRPISSTAIYGGAAYGPQIEALKSAQIVCATPGRLLDLLKQKELSLDSLRFFILDEADEMLSMGFERDLRAVLDYLPEERQSLLFSATVTEDVRSLAQKMLFYPEFLSFSSDSVVNQDVTHSYFRVNGISRMRDLIKVIELEEPANAIIFANTKDDTFLVNNYLQRHGYAAEALNGDLAQKDREKTLGKLRNKEINFLVATDVAARGIDITDLSHVINYVLPDSPEVYVHRTGRTGRAGNKGIAISLVSPAEMTSFILTKKRVDMDIAAREIPSTQEITDAKRARRTQSILEHLAAFDELKGDTFIEQAKALLDMEPEALTERLSVLLAIASHSLDSRGKLKRIKTKTVVVKAPEPAKPVQDAKPVKTVEPKEEEVEEVEEVEEDVSTEQEPRREKRSRRRDERRSERGDTRRNRKRDEEHEPEEEEVDDTVDSTDEVAEEAKPSTRSRREPREPREPRSEDSRERGGRGGRGGRERGGRERNSRRGERSERGGRGSRRRDSRRSDKPAAESTARKPAQSSSRPVKRDMSRLWLSCGKSVFKKQEDVLEFIVYNSGMDEEDFGDIRIERAHTFVDVRRDYIQDVINAIDEIEVTKGTVLNAKPARRS